MVPLMPQVRGITASMPSRNQPLYGKSRFREESPTILTTSPGCLHVPLLATNVPRAGSSCPRAWSWAPLTALKCIRLG